MEVKTYTESLSLEVGLKHLWEKVRTASERITELREQSQNYRSQIEYLEQEIVRLRAELSQKDQELKQLKVSHSALTNSIGGDNILTVVEKEALKTRIRELIATINSHL
jgi:uncharacterized coiled-coil DUF342 family protein